MIQLRNLCLAFGTQKIFDELNYTIAATDRVGLVGRNGTGKTTLLRAIAQGGKGLDDGVISVAGGCTIAYLPQELVLNSDRPLFDEAFGSYKAVGSLIEKMKALEPAVQAGESDAVQQYATMSERLAQLDVEKARRITHDMLLGLGFKEEQFTQPVTAFSVGWQMRIVLAKLLLQQADFYLFDEPTNHLDIITKDWFLDFLKDAPFGFLLVSHDRYFLDQLCTKIFELDRGAGTAYNGNYQRYVEQKEQALENLQAAFVQQQKELERKERLVERFKAKASKAKFAKSLEKSLDKIERIELPPGPRSVRFSFGNTERAGRMVLEVNDISYAYDDKPPVFEHVTFNVERGQKVALIAPNGGGKTTLFNVLCGNYKPRTGSITYGYNVHTAIFEQEQHKVLDPQKTVLQEVMDGAYNKPEQQIRSFLGSFLFGREEVGKKTKVLSGGERNRVSMVKVLLKDANFLLLDEPTNHLDIQSKEVLLQALTQFDGTVLFVSHDHDFVNKLATHILELTPQGVHSYHGNYDAWLAQKALSQGKAQAASGQRAAGQVQKETAPTAGQSVQKQLQHVERMIAKCEEAIEKIAEQFADIEYGTAAFTTAQQKLSAKQKELADFNEQWERLSSTL